MTGDDDTGAIRRRSTSRDEEEDAFEMQTARDHHPETAYRTGPSNPSSHNAGRNRVASTSGTDATPVTSPTTQQPRAVRFSTHLDRNQDKFDLERSQSDFGLNSQGWTSTSTNSGRNSKHALSVNTAQGEGESFGATRWNSGGNLTSPISPNSTSPLSPTSRARGYSLRRAVFNKNMTGGQSAEGSTIEMQEPGPSDGSARDNDRSTPKKTETVVTTTPISEKSSEGIKEKKTRTVTALPQYESWVQRRSPKKNHHYKRLVAAAENLRKTIFREHPLPPSKDGRQIKFDASCKEALRDERTGKAYVGNFIRSCRYNAWNFLPRQLFAQFSKLANFYFLLVSILQMIPGLSTTGSFTTIVPLIFFVSISMGKEGYDDFRRYKLDKEENNRETQVLRPNQSGPLNWTISKWHKLRVGDIVKLKRDEPAPADLVILHSSGLNGIAYVETMALDGETNLKPKSTTSSLAAVCATENDLTNAQAHFVVEDPNIDLYKFEGRVTVDGKTSALTNNEVIYRNSILRNTPECIGMVIYTGEECKIRMNANKHPRIKAPRLQFIVNRIVIVIVIFVLLLALFNTIAFSIWQRTTAKHAFYLKNAPVAMFPTLTAFFIMFNTMIPLSLYVSMEIVKLAQMILMNDVDMYDEKTNTAFKAQTSTINEELGQISYVFSDKTGTLTDNEMKFRKMSVAGTAWLHDVDLKKEDKPKLLHKRRSKGKKPARKSLVLERQRDWALEDMEGNEPLAAQASDNNRDDVAESSEPQWQSSARPAKSQPVLRTRELIRYIQRKPYTNFAMKARLFLLEIALCHTCMPEVKEDGTTDFQASSPDELALIRAAQELGYLFVDRNLATVTIKHSPTGNTDDDEVTETYEVLDVIEFSSKRKRMSIIVRFPNKRICVMTKGADSVIMKRLKLASLASRKVTEIELRADRRKSMEAQQALARKSSVQMEMAGSLSRPSMTLRRQSIGRLSMNGQRLQPVRDEVDHWLTERERDVDMSGIEENQYYSPRPSTQINRQSFAVSEARSSILFDDDEDLVDDTMANDDALVIERCFQHINDFATEGLRTLLYGYRFITEDDYAGWKKVYLDATTSLVDRERKIDQAGELIELDLELAGATAIEDKLQKGVPEAIDKLRRANIKMWMLTGDKRETAINIGHSCRLIKDYSTVVVLDQDVGDVDKTIGSALMSIRNVATAHCVVVIDGQTLTMIEETKTLKRLFFDLAIEADSVICCRASPSQKAKLVKAIRKRVKTSVTLAIGDGANDIAMIQEAHVGIGITGKEGLQAARTSDYAIAQFRFLTKLLLVHGRWNYIRTCKYIVGTFWKEVVFYLTQALYQRWCGYSATSLYEPWSLSMFNTLFTSLPVIFTGIFEKDLLPATLLAVPELYTKGQKNGGFNLRIYLGWTFMASVEAMIIFFCMWSLFGEVAFTDDNSLFAMGDMTFTACVVFISVKMLVIEMHNKSWLVPLALLVSIGGWFLWNILLSTIYHHNVIYFVKGTFFSKFGKNPLWWFTLVLILVSVIAFEIAVISLRATYFPTDEDTFQELETDLGVRMRFEEASAEFLAMGWEGKDEMKRKAEKERARKEETKRKKEEEQFVREMEVGELLRNRPSGVERMQGFERLESPEGTVGFRDHRKSKVLVEESNNAAVRKSADVLDTLKKMKGRLEKKGDGT
ncbi:phospholipid-translocating P-type ATPase [Venturia nashicola]|uniref:Phospholipid-transporting ATPase n=1 Tax=Venturia nashicola TaxID=86259 RepID=A0A4Z1NRX9_9PEZI|nr:phospholipid-translocating P-type ATPase [Venturia nashicola]